MAGGVLSITGDVGDHAASSLPGSMDGMRGGTFIVRGRAGARFADRSAVEAFATELTVTSGAIVRGESGKPEATLEVALVDYTGALSQGRLLRDDNPVLMTMELVLQVLE
jgi:hypothetical protein